MRAYPKYENVFKQPNISEALRIVELIATGLKPEEQAYTQGATAGALQHIFSHELGLKIGFFLNRKDGGRLAATRRNAANIAAGEKQREGSKQTSLSMTSE